MKHQLKEPIQVVKAGMGELIIDAEGVVLYRAFDVNTAQVVTVGLFINEESFDSFFGAIESVIDATEGIEEPVIPETKRILH